MQTEEFLQKFIEYVDTLQLQIASLKQESEAVELIALKQNQAEIVKGLHSELLKLEIKFRAESDRAQQSHSETPEVFLE